LQWHGDTFDLPEGATRLASSPEFENQAFRFGSAYGVQFHLEVSRAMAEEWSRVPAYGAYADRVLGRGSLPSLLEEFSARENELRDHGRRMFGAWIGSTLGAKT
jgi:GMP synthase (glutamine-hydrolysing)